MNLFDHVSLWRATLDVLWDERVKATTGQERQAIREELQTCIEALRSADMSLFKEAANQRTIGVPFRRVVDRLVGGYLETDRCGLIRRANHAAFTLLNWPLSFRELLTGLPLLGFIEKEDRGAFHAEFLKLRQRDISAVTECLVQLHPLHTAPMLVSLFAERMERRVNRFAGITWIITKVYPCDTVPIRSTSS